MKLAAVSAEVNPSATPSSATAQTVETPPIAMVVPPRAVRLEPNAVESAGATPIVATADHPAVMTAPPIKSATLLAVLIACAVYAAFA